jgi:outer membrane assembly lipoprotein YfgL
MRRALLLALALLVAACSSTEKPKPTPLEPVTPKVGAAEVWRAKVDGVPFPLVVAVNDGNLALAGGDGTVLAVAADSGRELWRASVGAAIAAGVGSDGRFAAVVTVDNELVVLDRASVAWRTRLPSRVSTPPLVAGERVFVMGVDRVVHAFDALDGRKLWVLRRPGEPLTLAATGVVTPFHDTLLVGQGPRLTGVDPLRGTIRWEVPLANPRGTNEVERLADLIGPVMRAGDTVCARAFQSAVGCADAARATLRWTKNVGGTKAVGGDAELVFGADGADRITAWRTASGDIAWTSEKLLYRGLSAPVVAGRSVVFADAEGQVHFLARDSGETLARLATDGSAVAAPPVVVAGRVVVVTRNGGVFGLKPD